MTEETVEYRESYEDIFLNDLDGYGKTAWGMTEDEVLRAETPRAERLERPGILAGGRTGTLRIKELRTRAGKFCADFIFEDSNQRLVQVNLTSLDEKNPRAGSEAFSILKKLLTERYGTPKVENGLSEVASWKVGKTIIELVHLDIRQVSSFMVISYKSAIIDNVASGNP
jgi:hypothetical protein